MAPFGDVTTSGISYFVVRVLLSFTCFHVDAATSATGTGNSNAASGCPRSCFCNSLSQIVYCSRRGLPAIPEGIPADTLQLNLNSNTFQSSSVGRRNFSRNVALQHLYMSDCGLERLDVDTFVDLIDLRWLDLSNNRLKVILDYTFRGLTLDHLFLNGNRQIQLESGAFDGLITAGLYLHDCSLKSVRVEVLSPLNFTLRNLWLNGNDIDRVDKSLSGIFSALQHLRLGSNPLHCGCEAVWLMEFYQHNSDVFKGASQPSCAAPVKLRGRHFNELSLTDFRCQAPVFNNIDIMLGDATSRLKCSASGDPAPTLFWIQPNGKTSKYSPHHSSSQPAAVSTGSAPVLAASATGDDGSRRTDGVLILGGSVPVAAVSADGLTGMYICVANNEAGNVTLAVNLSWPAVQHPKHGMLPLPRPTIDTLASSSWFPGQILLPVDADDVDTDGASDDTFPINLTLPGGSSGWNTVDGKGRDGGAAPPRLFSVAELICAIVVTHVGTLVVSLLLIGFYVHRRARRLRRQQQLLPPIHQTSTTGRPLAAGVDGLHPGHPVASVGSSVGAGYRQNGYQLPGLARPSPQYPVDCVYDNSTTRSGFSYHIKPPPTMT